MSAFLILNLFVLTSLVAGAPDTLYDGVKAQIVDIRQRCDNQPVCINKDVELTQSEAEIKKILEDTIRKRETLRTSRINSVCFAVVIENKMQGVFNMDNSRQKMMVAAYITYNLFERMSFVRPMPGGYCANRIAIFYSRQDSTLYTFATSGLMDHAEIRTASAAARPYFSNSILEGMRFLISAYIDTVVKASS